MSTGSARAAAREWSAGDELVVTRLDHDANVAPWLELARDHDLVVRFTDIRDDCTLDLADLERQLGERTRVVAFPWASNAVGTLTDVARIAELAHAVGALAWVDAVHYAPHGPIDVSEAGVDVLICSPYKFCGPHLGLAFGRAELLERWRPYKVRPAPNEPLGRSREVGAAEVAGARCRPEGGVRQADPVSRRLELLARLEQARRQAGRVEQPPEVVARVREVRTRRCGYAARVDAAEDHPDPGRKDVRDSARRAQAASGSRRSSRSSKRRRSSSPDIRGRACRCMTRTIRTASLEP